MNKQLRALVQKPIIRATIVLLILAILSSVFFLVNLIPPNFFDVHNYPQPVGTLVIGTDQKRVDAIKETEKRDLDQYGDHNPGTDNRGNECDVTVYGYDDSYVYSLIDCTQTYYPNQGSDEISTSKYSIHARYGYDASTKKTTVIEYERDMGVGKYLWELFPEAVYKLTR